MTVLALPSRPLFLASASARLLSKARPDSAIMQSSYPLKIVSPLTLVFVSAVVCHVAPSFRCEKPFAPSIHRSSESPHPPHPHNHHQRPCSLPRPYIRHHVTNPRDASDDESTGHVHAVLTVPRFAKSNINARQTTDWEHDYEAVETLSRGVSSDDVTLRFSCVWWFFSWRAWSMAVRCAMLSSWLRQLICVPSGRPSTRLIVSLLCMLEPLP
jgi:hypothetical protein